MQSDDVNTQNMVASVTMFMEVNRYTYLSNNPV